jgi:hypothetical protein
MVSGKERGREGRRRGGIAGASLSSVLTSTRRPARWRDRDYRRSLSAPSTVDVSLLGSFRCSELRGEVILKFGETEPAAFRRPVAQAPSFESLAGQDEIFPFLLQLSRRYTSVHTERNFFVLGASWFPAAKATMEEWAQFRTCCIRVHEQSAGPSLSMPSAQHALRDTLSRGALRTVQSVCQTQESL